jgi:hypothetical protein
VIAGLGRWLLASAGAAQGVLNVLAPFGKPAVPTAEFNERRCTADFPVGDGEAGVAACGLFGACCARGRARAGEFMSRIRQDGMQEPVENEDERGSARIVHPFTEPVGPSSECVKNPG